MQIRELLSDDDAVSPVIGVILMVAITVILAAVIASFVLGLGDQATNTQPQASFGFEYSEGVDGDSSNGEGQLTVTHNGGASIEAQELYVRGSGFANPSGLSTPSITGSSGSWADATGGTMYSDTDMISAGQSVYVGVTSGYEISIVYVPVEGGSSATLAIDKGPDA